MQRRTRIVATLGPATDRPGVLEQLLAAGLDVARINFSHGNADEHRARIQRLRQLADETKRPVTVLADLPGPKLRAILAEPLSLAVGQLATLGLHADASADIHLTEPEALARARIGQRVLFDDGRLQARITGVGKELVAVAVDVGGTLLPNKGINLPDTDLNIPAVTPRDLEAIGVALTAGADWLALSFVRDAAAAHDLRSAIASHGMSVPILAKIERPEAVKQSIDIINAFDGIMVARGDLGVEVALEKVPHVQKKLIQEARIAGKPVITATDMLDSMRKNPRPTRAEVSDVANAVYDGTDAVMLSGETAIGDYPVEAFLCMTRVLMEADAHQELSAPRHIEVPRAGLTDHITHMACDLAREIGARAIITPTLSGRTARLIARHHPTATIVAVADDAAVVRRLGFVWGVSAVQSLAVEPGGDRLEAAVHASFGAGIVKADSLVVVLARHPIAAGDGYPTIRVVRVGEDGRSREP